MPKQYDDHQSLNEAMLYNSHPSVYRPVKRPPDVFVISMARRVGLSKARVVWFCKHDQFTERGCLASIDFGWVCGLTR